MHRGLLVVGLIFLALCWWTPASAAGPGLEITSPANQSTIRGMKVTLAFNVKDFTIVPSTVPLADYGKRPDLNRPGEGHLHLMLDLQPLVIWDRAEPYTFTNVPPGQHELKVELANNDHSSLAPPVVQTIQFQTIAPQMLPQTGQGSDSRAIMALSALISLALLTCGFMLRKRGWRQA